MKTKIAAAMCAIGLLLDPSFAADVVLPELQMARPVAVLRAAEMDRPLFRGECRVPLERRHVDD